MQHHRIRVTARCAAPTAAAPPTSATADGNAHTAATVEAAERNNCVGGEPAGMANVGVNQVCLLWLRSWRSHHGGRIKVPINEMFYKAFKRPGS